MPSSSCAEICGRPCSKSTWTVSAPTTRCVCVRARPGPAPVRGSGNSASALGTQGAGTLACHYPLSPLSEPLGRPGLQWVAGPLRSDHSEPGPRRAGSRLSMSSRPH